MKNKKLLLPIILLTITVIFTIMVCIFDVSSQGLNDSHLGFTSLNTFMSARLPYNDTSRQISRYLGVIWFLPPIPFLIIAAIQFFKYRSLKKIDPPLFFLAGFYFLMGLTYLVSKSIFVNYRPILLDGELENSYPSSHTLFSTCISLSTTIMLLYYTKKEPYKKYRPYALAISVGAILLCIATILSRYLSGVHWTTDIIGGILISCTYAAFLRYCLTLSPKNQTKENKGA